MSAPRVAARAHAKINLSLRITGTRSDGYHDLHTVFQALALHDTVTAVARPGPFAVTCTTPGVPLDRTNLVWRSAEALWARLGRTGEPRGVTLDIRKRVPLQAGLGGGSADAAAALRALVRLWDVAANERALRETAAALGADVPFFLVGGAALGSGRGEVLRPLAGLPSWDVVLLVPAFGVSTREAYAWYDEAVTAGCLRPATPCWPESAAPEAPRTRAGRYPRASSVPWPPPHGELVNDLQLAVVARHPEIGELIRFLTAAGAETAAMSGSGSAVFGLFSSPEAARQAAHAARARDCTVLRSRTLDHAEYQRRARPVVADRHRG